VGAPRLSRVERMVAYLREHAPEIDALPFGSVIFDFGGDEIKAHVKRTDRLPDPPPLSA